MAGANAQIPDLRRKLEHLLAVSEWERRSLKDVLGAIQPEGAPDLVNEVFKYNRVSLNPKLEQALCAHFRFPETLPGWRERAPGEVTKRDGSLETFQASIHAQLGLSNAGEAKGEEDATLAVSLLGELELGAPQPGPEECAILLAAIFGPDEQLLEEEIDGARRERKVMLGLKEAAISVTLTGGIGVKWGSVLGHPKDLDLGDGMRMHCASKKGPLLWTVKAADKRPLQSFETADHLFIATGLQEGGVATARLHICAKFTQLMAPEDPDIEEEKLNVAQKRIIAALEKTSYFQDGKYERVLSRSKPLKLPSAEERRAASAKRGGA